MKIRDGAVCMSKKANPGSRDLATDQRRPGRDRLYRSLERALSIQKLILILGNFTFYLFFDKTDINLEGFD